MPQSYAQNSSNLGNASRWGRDHLVTPDWRYKKMKRRCWRAPLSCTASAQDLRTRSLTPKSAEVFCVVAMSKLRMLSSLGTTTSSVRAILGFVISRLVIQEQSVLEEWKIARSMDGRRKGRLACKMDLWPMLDCANSFQTRRLSSCLRRS